MHRVVAVLLAVTTLAVTATPTYACGDARLLDGNVDTAAVIVEGRVESATPRPELFSGLTAPKASTRDLFIPVELSVRVTRPFKGAVTDPFVSFARTERPLDGSVPRRADGSLRLAGGTGCAWPESDPTGDYVILLLTHGYGNRLVPLSSSRTFTGPADAALAAHREAILARLPLETDARTLAAPLTPDARPDLLMGAIVGVPLMLMAAAAMTVLVGGIPAGPPAASHASARADSTPDRELAPA